MKVHFFLLLALPVFIFSASQISLPKENGVYHLTDDTFDEALKTYDTLLIKFVTGWCKGCPELTKEFAKAAKSKEMKSIGVKFAEINPDYNPKTIAKYMQKKSSTVLLFQKGVKRLDYEGGKKKDDIILWVKKNIVSPFESVESPNDIAIKFAKHPEVPGMIYFGTDDAGQRKLKDYSMKNPSKKIGLCKNAELFSKLGVKDKTVMLFRPYDGKKIIEKDVQISKEKLDDLFYENSVPQLVYDIDFARDTCFELKRPVVVCLRDPSLPNVKSIDETFKKASEKFIGKIKFTLASSEEKFQKRLIEYLSIPFKKDKPSVFVMFFSSYLTSAKLTEDYNLENIVKFVDGYVKGGVKGEELSEEIPEKQGPLFKLVNKNFEEEVLNNDLNVLVAFHREGCPHCVRLMPEYEKLANALKGEKDIRIARFDVIKNHNKWEEIVGVPTIFLYTKENKKSPIQFAGERTVDAMKKFIFDNIRGNAKKPPQTDIFKLNSKNFEKKVLQNDEQTVFVKLFRKTCPHCVRLQPEYEKLATMFKGDKEVLIAEFDIEESRFSWGSFTGVPTLYLYVKGKKDKPVEFNGERKVEKLKEFIYENIGRKVEKKEEKKEETEKSDAIEFTTQTFQKQVIDNNAVSTLILYFRPSCPHCMKFKPEYEKLATMLKNDKTIEIGKMDTSKNRIEVVSITGVPTVYLFPKGNKKNPIKYTGARTVEALVKFINENKGKKEAPKNTQKKDF